MTPHPSSETRRKRLRGEEGATAVEYALFMALVAAVIAAVVMLLGDEVLGLFESVNWWGGGADPPGLPPV